MTRNRSGFAKFSHRTLLWANPLRLNSLPPDCPTHPHLRVSDHPFFLCAPLQCCQLRHLPAPGLERSVSYGKPQENAAKCNSGIPFFNHAQKMNACRLQNLRSQLADPLTNRKEKVCRQTSFQAHRRPSIKEATYARRRPVDQLHGERTVTGNGYVCGCCWLRLFLLHMFDTSTAFLGFAAELQSLQNLSHESHNSLRNSNTHLTRSATNAGNICVHASAIQNKRESPSGIVSPRNLGPRTADWQQLLHRSSLQDLPIPNQSRKQTPNKPIANSKC